MGCLMSKKEDEQGKGSTLEDPVLDFEIEEFQHEGVLIVQCAVQGYRKTMEDVALVECGTLSKKEITVLGVFDGHSGIEAASFARRKLLGNIEGTKEWKAGDIPGACKVGFLATDEAMRMEGVTSGTTAVVGFVTPTELIVANCGDSRSVLSRGGRQLPMSLDHKPGRKAERRRIIRSGGSLDNPKDELHARIIAKNNNMSIATSRALGDFDFKRNSDKPPSEQMVSPVPEFYQRERSPQDEFLILASDGVWDVMDNPEVVRFLGEKANSLDSASSQGAEQGKDSNRHSKLRELAKSVLYRCLSLGSLDNMTIVLADLRSPIPGTRTDGLDPVQVEGVILDVSSGSTATETPLQVGEGRAGGVVLEMGEGEEEVAGRDGAIWTGRGKDDMGGGERGNISQQVVAGSGMGERDRLLGPDVGNGSGMGMHVAVSEAQGQVLTEQSAGGGVVKGEGTGHGAALLMGVGGMGEGGETGVSQNDMP